MMVKLGTVMIPSGKAIIVDCGLLNVWSHDRKVWLPDGVLSSEEATARARDAVDYEVEGTAEAIRTIGARFLFDRPCEELPALEAQVSAAGARLRPLAERMTHLRRTELVLAQGAGEVTFHGITAAAMGDLPGGLLDVIGERMPAGPYEDRLRAVFLRAREGEIARSESIATVAVDWARLMIIDLEALKSWKHEDPIDGKADFAFWGLHAAAVAARVDAPALSANTFGWRDLPVKEAASRGIAVEEIRDQEKLRFATDFRPHSHHWQLMEQIRASPAASGVVGIDSARACGFMTTWGDGFFPVRRDLDAQGRLLQVRIELERPRAGGLDSLATC